MTKKQFDSNDLIGFFPQPFFYPSRNLWEATVYIDKKGCYRKLRCDRMEKTMDGKSRFFNNEKDAADYSYQCAMRLIKATENSTLITVSFNNK